MREREGSRASAARVSAALLLLTAGLMVTGPSAAQRAEPPALSADPALQVIRAKLTQRLSGLPRIDEISATGMPGLYEVRLGKDVYYSDIQGNYLIRGDLIETLSQRNLTRERIDKLSAIEFDKLPLQDAIVWKSGTGQRRIAVFADPNCGYCKKFETELQGLKDVTVYTFLYPILSPDSTTKSHAIWCSKDASQSWRNWMLQNTAPSQVQQPAGASPRAAPIERNLALGRRHRIEGVPAVVFEDGSRAPGLVTAQQLQVRLNRGPV